MPVAGGYSGTAGAGVGHVQLDGGLIDVTGNGGLIMSSSGSVDITGGILKLNGEVTNMSVYGNVTAYGGAGSFVYDYDGARTTVTAVPEPTTLALIGLGSLLIRRKRV